MLTPEGLLESQQSRYVVYSSKFKAFSKAENYQIDGPDSICECNITAESIGLFRVTYTPQEVGIFDVRVLWNGTDIPGSPFHPRIINPRKVRVIGGWESLMDSKNKLMLTVGEEKKISFDTVDAGPGIHSLKFPLYFPTY